MEYYVTIENGLVMYYLIRNEEGELEVTECFDPSSWLMQFEFDPVGNMLELSTMVIAAIPEHLRKKMLSSTYVIAVHNGGTSKPNDLLAVNVHTVTD